MGVPLTLSQVPNVAPYIQYVATSGQTVFPYPFPITQDSDLVAVVNGVTLATDNGYTLSGQGNPTGGNLTFTLGQTAGTIVTLFRNIAIQRITQIGQNSGYSSITLNAEFNNFYLIAQQLQASIAQCLQLPNTNNPQVSPILTPAAYANKYLSFDANGNPVPAALTTSGSLTAAQSLIYGTDSGVANAYVFSHSSLISASLTAGCTIRFIPLNPNTSAVTVNADGTGAVAVVRANGTACTGGEFSSLGPVVLQANGTQWQIVSTAGAQPGFERTAAEIAAAVVPSNYAYPPGHWYRYGAVADNTTNNSTAFANIQTLANTGMAMYAPFGTTGIYLTSTPLHFTAAVNITFDPGTRIKLTAAASYVMSIDGTAANIYGSTLRELILDANGNAPYGLDILKSIGGRAVNVRCTNATTAGMHWHWAQQWQFDHYMCSGNVEAFTTTPINGIVIDGGSSSSDNLLINPAIEKVSGAGILGTWAINSVVLAGTIEGNAIGVVWGHATTGSGIGNRIIGTDMEVNATTDVQILATGSGNTVDANAGFSSGAMTCDGKGNNFMGVTGGVTFSAASSNNRCGPMTIIGTGRTITDSGTGNAWGGGGATIYNSTDAVIIAEKQRRGRTNYVLSTTGAVSTDCSVTNYDSVTYNGAGAGTITFNAPTNPSDGMQLRVGLYVTGAGTITLAWASGAGGFKPPTGGVTVAANTFHRFYDWVYDANQGFWEFVVQTAVDVPN